MFKKKDLSQNIILGVCAFGFMLIVALLGFISEQQDRRASRR